MILKMTRSEHALAWGGNAGEPPCLGLGRQRRRTPVVAVKAFHDDRIARAPFDQLERAGPHDRGGQALSALRFGEVLGNDFVQGQECRELRPRRFQLDPRRAGIDDLHVRDRPDQAFARAGFAADGVVLGQAFEGVFDVFGGDRRSVMKGGASLQLDLVGRLVDDLQVFGQLRDHLHVRVAGHQAVVHVADDRLGRAVAVVVRVQGQGVGGVTDPEFTRLGRDRHRNGGGGQQ
jgi:hypothetical protein